MDIMVAEIQPISRACKEHVGPKSIVRVQILHIKYNKALIRLNGSSFAKWFIEGKDFELVGR